MMDILKILLIFLPSKVKLFCYRALGAKIGNNCYIGFSIVAVKDFEMGDCVYIGHFNLLWRLKKLKMGSGSRISLLNWISGAIVGSFYIGTNSSISCMHFFEASNDILIGSNSIIAGRSSQFFSHGITPDNIDERMSISIGDWCYIGSAARFVPGAKISDHTFVGMGAVITKQHGENYVLIAGCPARKKKELNKDAAFFNRQYLPHAHHPTSYDGKTLS